MAGPSQVPTRICVVPGWLTNRASLAHVVLGEEVLCNYLAIDSFDETIRFPTVPYLSVIVSLGMAI